MVISLLIAWSSDGQTMYVVRASLCLILSLMLVHYHVIDCYDATVTARSDECRMQTCARPPLAAVSYASQYLSFCIDLVYDRVHGDITKRGTISWSYEQACCIWCRTHDGDICIAVISRDISGTRIAYVSRLTISCQSHSASNEAIPNKHVVK